MPIESNILLGTVLDTADPDGLGRVQVELRGFESVWKTPWLRVLQPTASTTGGHHFLPEKDSEVVVLRGFGNHIDGLIVIGALYGTETKPKVTAALRGDTNDVKEIMTRSGARLSFSDKDGEETVTLETGDKKLQIVMDVKAGSVSITGDKEVTITSSEKLVVNAKEVEVNAETSALIKTKTATLEAKTVELKGTSTVAADSALTIDCKAALSLKGTSIALG